MKRRRDTPRRGRKLDPDHLFHLKLVGSCWVREFVPGATPCSGGFTENDHSSNKRGIGQKCDDDLTADICNQHHHERTNHYGTFKHMSRETERAYLARAIERAQRAVAAWRRSVDIF